jgi:hypothetical protein
MMRSATRNVKKGNKDRVVRKSGAILYVLLRAQVTSEIKDLMINIYYGFCEETNLEEHKIGIFYYF